MKIALIKAAELDKADIRLDASYHLSDGVRAKRLIKKSGKWDSLASVTKAIFLGARFRRKYVEDPTHGYPYLTASDMTKAKPLSGVYLSKVHTENIEKLKIQQGWILVSCSGSIGRTAYTNSDFEGQIGTHDLIRIVPDTAKIPSGYLYAFLTSKFGFALLEQSAYGVLIQHIEPEHINDLPVPRLPAAQMQQVHDAIEKATTLREMANQLLVEADAELMNACGLPPLTRLDYEYFGSHAASRPLSTFTVRNIEPTSLAAFNYSARVNNMRERISARVKTKPLADCIAGGSTFSTGSFKRFELNSPKSIELINQSDIFDNRIQGKMLARHYISNQRLVEYGEVLIAGVGTLGENETFCRALFAGQDLVGKLISGEFIRMKADPKVLPAGYLYAWLASDYGFRLLRATQGGTKLCRPIPRLLADIPVPLLAEAEMVRIAALVETAQANRYQALQLETQAIHTIETAISAWQK